MVMLIRDLYENTAPQPDDDDPQTMDNWEALDQTGYYGRAGAGCIFFAQDTKRFCLFRRSKLVQEPFTWNGVGGAIDNLSEEGTLRAVKREAQEEAGYAGPLKLVPFYIFRDGSFQYSNFVGIVPQEFEPRLNWESTAYEWVTLGKWPQPLHFGLVKAFSDPKAQTILTKISS